MRQHFGATNISNFRQKERPPPKGRPRIGVGIEQTLSLFLTESRLFLARGGEFVEATETASQRGNHFFVVLVRWLKPGVNQSPSPAPVAIERILFSAHFAPPSQSCPPISRCYLTKLLLSIVHK